MFLSLKTNAFAVFSGNESGGTLSMQLSGIGYTALSIGLLTPPMKKGFQTSQGTLSYISADRLQSAPVFVTSTCDAGVVKMFFTINGVIIAVFTGDGTDFTPDFVPTSMTINFSASTSAPTTAEILRGMQKLGGSEGYQAYLTSQASAVAGGSSLVSYSSPKANDDWNSIVATLTFGSAFAYTWPSIETGDAYKGKGGCWGPGLGAGHAVGVLRYVDWNKLTSVENDFQIAAGGAHVGGVVVYFKINGEDVAWFAGAGEVVGGLIGLKGKFDSFHVVSSPLSDVFLFRK